MSALRADGGADVLTGPGATIGNARRLRKEMTLPEVVLWQELRRRPGGFRYRRQHPAGPYVLDFACLSARLAIEVDGMAHTMGNVAYHDDLRDEWLANQGFLTLRIAAKDVLSNIESVIKMIVDRCQQARPLHRPPDGPPPRAGEEL